MDDLKHSAANWLTFSLGLPKATQRCNSLRASIPDVDKLKTVINKFIENPDDSFFEKHISREEVDVFKKLLSTKTYHKICTALEWEAQSDNHHLLDLNHPTYPELLRNTDYAPPILYAKGSLEALDLPLIAVVGSRKASHAALKHTHTLCAELAELGIGIISGLAVGVDAAAHEGALSAHGTTIAVAATEPDRVYPSKHADLCQRIISSGGLMLTEYPIGSVTRPWFFPRRNRIISGLSLGVIVAEAALPSGSLTTATHAMNQGREVMAVPGSIHNLQAKGCHSLIKQGAALVETTKDIVDVLESTLQRAHSQGLTELPKAKQATTPPTSKDLQKQFDTLSDQDRWILEQLSAQAATVDDLMTLSSNAPLELNITALTTALGWLEIKGLILCEMGGRYARC